MKRVLSSLLCLMLLVGCMTTAAFASAEPAETQDETVLAQDGLDDDLSADKDESGGGHSEEDEPGKTPENPTTSGTIEDANITWAVEDGTLTVSGTGAIPDYDSEAAPWKDCWNLVEKIVISDGITKIGSAAFSSFTNVTKVTIGEGVTAIPANFCADCSALETINLPSTIETLGDGFVTISEDSSLQTITVADRDGYKLSGWMDSSGKLWTNDDIINGLTAEAGTLTAQWSSTSEEESNNPFTDVAETDWFYTEVLYCYQNKLMTGMTETTFSPYTYGTRAQVVTVLYRMAGEPAVTSSTTEFSDVPTGQWYTDAVIWAEANGITSGYEDGTFRPNRSVTRQEFITFLYRYLVQADSNAYAQSTAISTFADGDTVQSWAKEAENWSLDIGLQNGYVEDEVSYLRPDNSVRRSEIAAFLSRCQSGTADTKDDRTLAEELMGQDVEALYAAIGKPEESQYSASCLVAIDGVDDGLLYYGDFVVATLRHPDGTELIVAVY